MTYLTLVSMLLLLLPIKSIFPALFIPRPQDKSPSVGTSQVAFDTIGAWYRLFVLTLIGILSFNHGSRSPLSWSWRRYSEYVPNIVGGCVFRAMLRTPFAKN